VVVGNKRRKERALVALLKTSEEEEDTQRERERER
jgi:hypothetical protein